MASIFRTHDDAAIITSLTGIGDVLGAEFLAVVCGSLAGFASADHLAGYAGLAPAPHDSGYRTGTLHQPQRYNRQLQRVFLHLSHHQHPTQPSLNGLLRRQTSPGQAADPGCPGPRPTTRQRALGLLRDHHPY